MTNKYLLDYVYLAEACYANFEKKNGIYKTDDVQKAIQYSVNESDPDKAEKFAELVTKNKVQIEMEDKESNTDIQ